jgi:hypothetical protein
MIFPKSFVSTFFHVLELAVILALVYGISLLFDIKAEQYQVVILVILSALAKLVRAEPKSPINDYVNS